MKRGNTLLLKPRWIFKAKYLTFKIAIACNSLIVLHLQAF